MSRTTYFDKPLADGYVCLGVVSLHLDDLEQFTTDVDRLVRYAKPAYELLANSDCLPMVARLCNAVDSVSDLCETADELAALYRWIEQTYVGDSGDNLNHAQTFRLH